jgi:uncharacterized membrane protein
LEPRRSLRNPTTEGKRVITHSIEIARPPEEVFAYLDELDKHSEWQDGLVSSRIETEGPVRVGTRVVDKRQVPGGPRDMTYEVTEHDPPRRSAWRGLDGPIRPVGSVTVEPVGDGTRSRVNLELNLEGHGVGVLFAPFVNMQARKQVPKSQERLKEILESRAA